MKKILHFIGIFAVCIGVANAAVRDENATNRQSATASASNSTISRTASTKAAAARNVTARTATSQPLTSRTTQQGATISRTDSTTGRSATARATQAVTPTTTARSGATVSRSATAVPASTRGTTTARSGVTVSRAAIDAVSDVVADTRTGAEYEQCKTAYFNCMDQFCATANDSYRRCVCSSRLTDIQERERALSQASGQLQDFKDLNIEVIPKTAEEVNAMLTASEGELAMIEDTSESSQQLAGIREVLSSTKNNALSTLGTLDIAGDINQIWATTDLASGQNIANLTGEALYNAVHSQCIDLIADQCPSSSTLDMVVSAYGMYIENDCSTLLNALNTQLVQANSSIRETEREMNQARLENYNAHNSTAINDCIAQVRADITADTACGTDYVHCLDITGRYLNRDTGEPIYSADFYQLGNQISLEGDVLTNATNRMIVAELNNKRIYAARGLETCRDIADEVWDEFVRQAIVEIYQGQQEKIRDVKNECLDVVNTCYDEQSESLKDFSNVKEELLTGSRLELSEELCQEKLYACSNLYGDPNGDGLELLLTAMHDITDQKIAAQCQSLLEAFATDMCAVPSNDTLHNYPYGCRVYAPGDAIYASNWFCNQLQWDNSSSGSGGTGGGDIITPITGYSCPTFKKYTSCNYGYYMATQNAEGSWSYNGTPVAGNRCLACPAGSQCPGGTDGPQGGTVGAEVDEDCGDDYAGSLYQRMVKYATQVCVRPSDYDKITTGELSIPTTVLQDVNIVMDKIRVDMATVLSTECDRLGGTWVDTQWIDETGAENGGGDGKHDKTGHQQYKYFYDETGSNTKWGYCADTESVSTATQGL